MSKFVDLAYKHFGKDSVTKGLMISPSDVTYYDTTERGKSDLVHIFQVNSQHRYYYYDVNIITRDNDIVSFYCECKQFANNHTCKHVAACLLNYGNKIIKEPPTLQVLSNDILNYFLSDVKGGIKEAVGVDLELDFSDSVPTFKLFIGLKKKYVINNESKFSNFMSAFLNDEEYVFGANFTYDPNIHYFNDDDSKLLSFLNGYTRSSNNFYYNHSNPFTLNDRELSTLIGMIRNRPFSIAGYGKIYGVNDGMPTSFNLSTKDDGYELSIDDFSNYSFIDRNVRFVVYNHFLYIIPSMYQKFLSILIHNSLASLTFDKDKTDLFKNGLLQNLKNNIVIDDNITDIVVAGTPDVSLYFDFEHDKIFCKVKFDYKGSIIDYFDVSSSVVREVDFEASVISDLVSYNFLVDKKKIFISDIDDIGNFLCEGLSILGDKYKVYTSKKIDSIDILKKSNVQSNFSIGIDGIMSYSFSTDNIDFGELSSIFSALKKNKHYYKLKNGNFVDLYNNSEINELSNIFDDLDISSFDSSVIEIPKYRALYIDSLKHNKYKSIKTDNSFDRFIDNFSK